jgi:hypothetical protein
MRTTSRIEPLESRIAPAVTIVGPHVATYDDVDGDHVTITVSTGTLTTGLFITKPAGLGQQLETIDFSAGGFDATNLTVSVVKVPDGDGLANVGFINSMGHDLGLVHVAGDLGRINAGDNVPTTAAIKQLFVRTMGVMGTETQAMPTSFESDIHGDVNAITIRGDLDGAFLNVTGFGQLQGLHAKIGTLTVGGSFIGAAGDHSGSVKTTGAIGTVTIRQNLFGGGGQASGALLFDTGTSVTVGGSLEGGMGQFSGSIDGERLNTLTVGHSAIGGRGGQSGSLEVASAITLTLRGSVVGGGGDFSGGIRTDVGGVTTLIVGHDVVGGSGQGSGEVQSGVPIKSIHIGGSVLGGAGPASGVVSDTGGSIVIVGDVVGGGGDSSGLVLSAGKSLLIGGDVIGGSITGSASLRGSGLVEVEGGTALTINGSVIAGRDDSTGSLLQCGGISLVSDVGSPTIMIRGSLIGHPDLGSGEARVLVISEAFAKDDGSGTFGFTKFTVQGSVEHADILVGYDFQGAQNNILKPDSYHVKAGPVMVGGDWVASNLAVGVQNLGTNGAPGGTGSAADNINFGDTNDAINPDFSSAIFAPSIASITIGGQVYGTRDSLSSTDHFGFAAQTIGPVKINGVTIPVPTNSTPKNLVSTNDASIHLVIPPS